MTHVPFFTRGLGMLPSGSAPRASVASSSARHTVDTTQPRRRVTRADFSSAAHLIYYSSMKNALLTGVAVALFVCHIGAQPQFRIVDLGR